MDEPPTPASTLRRAIESRREREPHHALDPPPGPFRLSGSLRRRSVPEAAPRDERDRVVVLSDYFLG